VCSYSCYSENLNWAAQNLQLGRGLDIAVLEHTPLPRHSASDVIPDKSSASCILSLATLQGSWLCPKTCRQDTVAF